MRPYYAIVNYTSPYVALVTEQSDENSRVISAYSYKHSSVGRAVVIASASIIAKFDTKAEADLYLPSIKATVERQREERSKMIAEHRKLERELARGHVDEVEKAIGTMSAEPGKWVEVQRRRVNRAN